MDDLADRIATLWADAVAEVGPEEAQRLWRAAHAQPKGRPRRTHPSFRNTILLLADDWCRRDGLSLRKYAEQWHRPWGIQSANAMKKLLQQLRKGRRDNKSP